MLRIPIYYSIFILLPLLLPLSVSWPVLVADNGHDSKQHTAMTYQVPFQSPQLNHSTPFTEPWLHRLEHLYKTFGQQQGMQQLLADQQCAYSLPDFDCEPYDSDDGLRERDAFHLRPQDIQLMISLGDSITAGFGMMSGRPPFASVWEYRGKVFSIGGDPDEEYTLPAFWSSYSDPSGPSHGVTLPLARGKQLNNAVSGAKAQDLDLQVTRLVQQLQTPDYIENKDAWKVITLFIGANNVCVLCTPPITQLPDMAEVDVFETHVRLAVERLRNEVGHAFVNLVALFNVSSVYEAARGNPYCEMVLDPSHMVVCSCLQSDERKRQAADLVVKGYNERLDIIAQDYQNLHDPHFAVFYQPGFKFFPVGKYKQRYLSGIDCFHPNRCANQVMATVLWNNMFSSREEKFQPYHVSNLTFKCPGTQHPYLR
ncbi:hypothetical protein BCR42DRAFT_453160 [Absidia repens]|uniref:Uncharacterized protein n=1 Tax=Absidia repens TaxID=90262 RepID=A0A1X2IB59_9FUNG|nr:hypothetical protein BCR42DRAFT_453160 [Absidia repens]